MSATVFIHPQCLCRMSLAQLVQFGARAGRFLTNRRTLSGRTLLVMEIIK